MVKLLSVMLRFAIYCLLNIYEGMLMSGSPMAAHCQHACKRFTLYAQLYCSTTYKTFSPINTDAVCQENVTKARILLYAAVRDPPF